MSSFRVLGVLLVAGGLPVLLDSFARFALQGLGMPAPIFPTQYLVVSGLIAICVGGNVEKRLTMPLQSEPSWAADRLPHGQA